MPRLDFFVDEKFFLWVALEAGTKAIGRSSECEVQLSYYIDASRPANVRVRTRMSLTLRKKTASRGVPIIMLSARGEEIDRIVGLEVGADDYLAKPFSRDELVIVVEKAFNLLGLQEENQRLRDELEHQVDFSHMIGISDGMQHVFEMVRRVAPTEASVLITGESGTGKELIARAIHFNGPRKRKVFLSENCAAIPETLLESELFGYAKGAFTHASSDHKGLFEAAHGGTIFLDEIGDIAPSIQTKLLQVLENNEFKPLGRNRTVKVDVRVLAATNRDLKAKMATGEFREDLYYRLCVVELPMPALAERQEDLPLLVDHFLDRYCGKYGREKKRLAPDVMPQLMAHE